MEHLKIRSLVTLAIEGKEVTLRVVETETDTCNGCYFRHKRKCALTDETEAILGACSCYIRPDGASVIFKKID